MANDHEADKSSTKETQWSLQDYLLVSLAMLIKVGDGVEGYLPGVITQKVSCELGLSDFQEGVLAVVLIFFWTISILVSMPIANRLGERITLFLSLYLSIIFAVLCAFVPNYYTLLLSRALTGICAGLNSSVTSIFLAKHVSSKDVLTKSSFLAESMSFAVGGTWVSVLGWLCLDIVGWRIFILLTSIPFFVPPILILHFCISDKLVDGHEVEKESGTTNSIEPKETDGLVDSKSSESVPNFTARVIKSSLFAFSNLCIGYGSIILLPWLIRSYKEGLHEDKCSEVVQGNDFLILAAVTGAANVIGRPLGYFLWSRVRFLILQSSITVIMALSYGIILTEPGLFAAELLLGAAKLCYSIQGVEVAQLYYDYDYYGKSRFELGIGVTTFFGSIGCVVGTTLAAFLDPYRAVLTTLLIACMELAVICFMKERF